MVLAQQFMQLLSCSTHPNCIACNLKMTNMSLILWRSLVWHDGPQAPMICVDGVMLAGVVDFEVCHPVCAGVFHFLCWVSTHQSLSSIGELIWYGANCCNSVAVAVVLFVFGREQYFWDSSRFLGLLPSKSFSLGHKYCEHLIANF